MTAREITGGEETLLRASGQHSETYLWVHNPATVFSARINQATFGDPVIEVIYDGATGSYAGILPGMTLRIGSAAGLDDLGKTRIRKAATATRLYIGSAGEIAWADNLYLTVVDDFELWWKKAVLQADGTYLLDEDVVYSDQHEAMDPVPAMSCDGAAWLSGDPATATMEFHADPRVLGSTIATHAWSVTPATGTTITNGSTADASIDFTVAGTYRIAYTVTAANGKAATGYRYAYIFDDAHPPIKAFGWSKISGETGSGGYSTEVTVWSGAGLTQIRPGARVMLFARDWFGSTQQDLGPLAGRENVLLAGWVASEVSSADPRLGSVRFTIGGGAALMRQISGQPVGIKDMATTPDRWTRFEGMTLDHYLWHLVHWRSTIDAVMDVYLTGDTRLAGEFASDASVLWDQLSAVSQNRLLARPGVNRYGQLFVRRNPQTLSLTERASLATIQTLEKQDWEPPLDIDRITATRTASLELSGIAYSSPGVFQALYSKAPGTALLRTGAYEMQDNQMLVDQAQANELAGRELARRNNPYPNVPLTLKGNNRFVDFAEPAYVAINLAAGDTPRGIVWSGQKLIATRVELIWNAKTGRMHTEIECEAETNGPAGITIIPPQPPTVNIFGGGTTTNPFGGGWPKWTWTPPPHVQPPYIPPELPPSSTCTAEEPANGPYDTWIRGTYTENGGSNGWEATAEFPCLLRAATSPNRSTYTLRAHFLKSILGVLTGTLDDDFYDVIAAPPPGSGFSELVAYKDAISGDGSVRTGYFDAPVGFVCARIILRIYMANGSFDAQQFSTNSGLWNGVDFVTHSWDNPTFAVVGNTVHFTGVYNAVIRRHNGVFGGHVGPYSSIWKDRYIRAHGTCVIQSDGSASGTGTWKFSNVYPYGPPGGTDHYVAAGALPTRAVDFGVLWSPGGITGDVVPYFAPLETYFSGGDPGTTHWYFDMWFAGEPVNSRIDVISLYISNVCPVP